MTESTFVTEYRKRPRWAHAVDVTGFFAHTGEPLPRIIFWVNTKADDIAAIRAAHIAADRVAQGLTDGARRSLVDDHDLLTDLKTCEALWRACRNADDPTEPAFITPEWMQQTFDSEQLGALLNCYLECRKRKGPRPLDINADWVESIRRAIVALDDEAIPELPLVAFSRDYLSSFVVAMARAWTEECSLLHRRIDELEVAAKDTNVSRETPGNEPESV